MSESVNHPLCGIPSRNHTGGSTHPCLKLGVRHAIEFLNDGTSQAIRLLHPITAALRRTRCWGPRRSYEVGVCRSEGECRGNELGELHSELKCVIGEIAQRMLVSGAMLRDIIKKTIVDVCHIVSRINWVGIVVCSQRAQYQFFPPLARIRGFWFI